MLYTAHLFENFVTASLGQWLLRDDGCSAPTFTGFTEASESNNKERGVAALHLPVLFLLLDEADMILLSNTQSVNLFPAGSENGPQSTLVRGGDGALQSRSRRASATGQETYETELVLPERGVYLAAAVYRPVVQFMDKAAQIVKDAALMQG